MVQIGDAVVFVDSHAREHDALVTNVFGITGYPAVNVVFVSEDTSRTDSCGRQIERQTSVVHQTSQPAHGMYWREK